MDIVTESAKEAINSMAVQLISYLLIVAAAYVVPYLLLGIIRVPTGLKNFISSIFTLSGMYYGFIWIFSK